VTAVSLAGSSGDSVRYPGLVGPGRATGRAPSREPGAGLGRAFIPSVDPRIGPCVPRSSAASSVVRVAPWSVTLGQGPGEPVGSAVSRPVGPGCSRSGAERNYRTAVVGVEELTRPVSAAVGSPVPSPAHGAEGASGANLRHHNRDHLDGLHGRYWPPRP